MANDNDHISEDGSKDDFSLESILAEYKGSAFINSEKKTPKAVLNEQAEMILKEATGSLPSDSLLYSALDEDIQKSAQEALQPQQASAAAEHETMSNLAEEVRTYTPKVRPDDAREELEATKIRTVVTDQPEAYEDMDATIVRADASRIRQKTADSLRTVAKGAKSITDEAHVVPPGKKSNEKDNVISFFETYQPPETDPDTIVRDVEKAIEKELGYAEPLNQPQSHVVQGEQRYGFDDEYFSDEYFDGEQEPLEPDLKEAVSRFAVACNSISLRCVPAAIVTLIMIILTFSFEAGLLIPFGIGHSQVGTTGILIIGLLFVMMLCADIVVRGAMSLIRGAPNAETLILFSCVFSFISAVFTALSDAPIILPYCAVSALTLTFAAFGEKFSLRAITDTLKTASGSSEPYGLQAEYNGDLDKSVLKKAYNRTDGFYNNLMHPDISELIYRYAAPILIAASLLLSLLFVLVRGGAEHFLHALSATLAAAAPFSLLLTFSVPFGTVAKSIRRSGAAIAGWGGADDICFTDGASVTDEDIFPPGTLALSGMKLFDGTPPEKAIRYTSSLIAASGSGLSVLFEEVLKTQGMNTIRVEDFAPYEGGISALIRGERVATGSGAFMNLIGVRVPDDTNIKSAVYTAVNDRLIAMFNVEYTPINSVQSALISMRKWQIKVFFAVRDFNATPLMIEQKFRVPLDNFEFIQAKNSYVISDSNSGKQGRMAAILTREGLGPFAEAITGGRLLKSAAIVATAVSVASAAIGVLIMFYIYWSGAIISARPGNLLLFMLSMLAAVLIVCGYVKCKK
ncbi:MAG: hypothetical protein FWC66_01540 [Oscillospiraceae bacterium]|nr:hypothetical protein [Oscillospiraceae bacterium]